MAITYNAGTNIITITGYTSGTPCTFLDIYNADVAGGWGVVTRQCLNQYCIDAKIDFGDGSTATYFADINKMIIIPHGYSSVAWVWTVKNNTNVRLGTLIDATTKTTRDGCIIISIDTTSGTYGVFYGEDGSNRTLELYNTRIDLPYIPSTANRYSIRQFSGTTKIYNFVSLSQGYYLQNADIYDVVMGTGKYALERMVNCTFDRLFLHNCTTAALLAYDSGINVKNVIAKNNTNLFRDYHSATDSYLINVDSDAWTFNFINAYTAKVYRQYKFDLKVIDKDNAAINGATVKIWDKDSNLIVDTTTNASGVIATQTITRGYYNKTNGDTLQEASPHLIKIEKASYTTYEADFTLDAKKDWLIALQVGGGLMRNPSLTGGMV